MANPSVTSAGSRWSERALALGGGDCLAPHAAHAPTQLPARQAEAEGEAWWEAEWGAEGEAETEREHRRCAGA